MFSTLIEATDLRAHLQAANWVVVDCRFSLADAEAGRRNYLAGHIPGAIYAHLDEDLSNPPATDNGRHPLPPPAILQERFGRMGIMAGKQVVAYDDTNGGIAARLWWLLRYMGHEAAAVLNGGWAAWQEGGFPVRGGLEEQTAVLFQGEPRTDWLVTLPEVIQGVPLIDSRDGARYRGEMEPIDPVAGHIPGARHYFYQENWGENGRYLPSAQLKAQFETVLGQTKAEEAVFYCGSGVTACVNLLAMAEAGLGNGRLYAGSWSEWCRDPQRPIAPKV